MEGAIYHLTDRKWISPAMVGYEWPLSLVALMPCSCKRATSGGAATFRSRGDTLDSRRGLGRWKAGPGKFEIPALDLKGGFVVS